MYCKNCGKEMPNDAVMCVGCGKLIDGAEAIIKASAIEQNVRLRGGKIEQKATKAWIFSMVAFILYFSVQLLATVIPLTLAKVILYGLFMAPILVMAILGMVASVKEYKKTEQRTFMFIMLLLSILFLVQAIVVIVAYAVGFSVVGGIL
ncbi:MAG: hypothetical protein K2I79_05190 [Clostridia bacterium]|nr:hypothetical protein [Clostridia bacterium]